MSLGTFTVLRAGPMSRSRWPTQNRLHVFGDLLVTFCLVMVLFVYFVFFFVLLGFPCFDYFLALRERRKMGGEVLRI